MDNLTQKIEVLLWDSRGDTLPLVLRIVIKPVRFLYAILRDVLTTTLTLRAMGLVYITILSIVPLLALAFSALKGFGIHRSRIEPALLNVLEPLGDKGVDLTNQLVDFVDIYTSFAVVIIALMWLYISWIILLVGAQASFYAQHPEYIRAGYRQISVGHELRERIALGLMVLVARAFRSPSQPSMNTNEIAARMNVPGILVSPIKQRLIANGVLATLDKDILVPARDPVTTAGTEPLRFAGSRIRN